MNKIICMFIFIFNFTGLLFSDEYEEVKNLLSLEEGGEIKYLLEINLGIPGGRNWIVNRDKYLYIYLVDDNKDIITIDRWEIYKQSEVNYLDVNSRSRKILEFDIMRNIPGTQLGDLAVSFGDYNGNGRDEILIFIPTNEDRCEIWGYDIENKKIENYFFCRYNITNPEGPSPIEFTEYLDMEGIMIYLWDYPIEQYIWSFFAWDEHRRKFTLRADLKDRNTESLNTNIEIQNKTEDNSTVKFNEEATKRIAKETEMNQFPLWLFIGGGLVLLAVVVGVGVAVKRHCIQKKSISLVCFIKVVFL